MCVSTIDSSIYKYGFIRKQNSDFVIFTSVCWHPKKNVVLICCNAYRHWLSDSMMSEASEVWLAAKVKSNYFLVSRRILVSKWTQVGSYYSLLHKKLLFSTLWFLTLAKCLDFFGFSNMDITSNQSFSNKFVWETSITYYGTCYLGAAWSSL